MEMSQGVDPKIVEQGKRRVEGGSVYQERRQGLPLEEDVSVTYPAKTGF